MPSAKSTSGCFLDGKKPGSVSTRAFFLKVAVEVVMGWREGTVY